MLDGVASDVRVALGPTLLDLQVDPATASDCTRIGEMHERMECYLHGRVVVLVRFDDSFRGRMVALDKRLRASGWGRSPNETKDTSSLNGVMVHYWDSRDPGDDDDSIGDLAQGGYAWRAEPGEPRRSMTFNFFDEGSAPPLTGTPRTTPAPIPGLRRGTFAVVLSVQHRYFYEPESPGSGG